MPEGHEGVRFPKRTLDKIVPYLIRSQGLRAVIIILLLLLISAVVLSVISARDMKRIIKEDFNSQQLELARHAAGILTEDFRILKRELTTLSLSPSIEYVEEVSWANRMKISFSTVYEYGVAQIMLVSAEGDHAYVMSYSQKAHVKTLDYKGQDFFRWCRNPQNQGQIFISNVRPGVVANAEPGFIKLLAIPVYQISTDEAHPEPTGAFTGALVFVLDAGALASKVVGPIRSGKTGYAWVIDDAGNFLYHRERDFLGENAFEVRRYKDSHISFSKINLIQKEKMLQGEEGTSWYISGWHRGVTGRMQKLIAYAPVRITAANTRRIWSVAVVAPISEVEEVVQSVYVRQLLTQGAFVIAAVIIVAIFIAMERSWLRSLEHSVKEKTRDLEQYAMRLRRSEERYRSLIEMADDMIYTLDRDGRIVSINQYYQHLTGQAPETVVGARIDEIIAYKDQGHVPHILAKVLGSDESLEEEEQVTIKGQHRWFDTKYKSMHLCEEHTGCVLAITRDITEHRRMEMQLSHAEKLASLGSLSSGVAHEINNPIAIILGFTEMLLERFPADSKEHQILKAIERQGNNCKRIVENLLAFARIPQKTAMQADVVEDLQRVVNVVMNTLLTSKVDLKTAIEEDLPHVRGDGPQLEQVFLNIINNAVAAMENGGILTISAYRNKGMVCIEFADTGSGIAPEIRDKIFEPFFTTKKVGEGTGLGLSVSYAIIKRFGGDIQVRSRTQTEGETPGATFIVSLPEAGDMAEGRAGATG